MRFLNLYHKKRFKPEPKSLRIDGVSTKMTAKPDDAELAAHALLEHMSFDNKKRRTKDKGEKQPKKAPSLAGRTEGESDGSKNAPLPSEGRGRGGVEYYRNLSAKIKAAHEQEARDAMRYLAYTEQELKERPSMEQLIEIERGLYQYQDTIDREGGELKKRWQHCLADVLVLRNKADGAPARDLSPGMA